jgi:hypothetical protein
MVAYGIHVYGRGMTFEVSRHVLVDDPDKIHFGFTHLDDRGTVRTPGAQETSVHVPARADAEVAKQADTKAPLSGVRYAHP